MGGRKCARFKREKKNRKKKKGEKWVIEGEVNLKRAEKE